MHNGVDPEEILKNAMKNFQRKEDPFEKGEKKVEFDPSLLQLDPRLTESFKQMMEERGQTPEVQQMI
jgi:hypothetical protein